MDISIVSGTYNRLPYLQKMVYSVRNSFEGVYGLEYEIVLVDGGSGDTTQEWCHQQPDIRLIEHGKLMGAVKAFNDGAHNADGQYVIMANDDIEFVEDSIVLAYLYMETHPTCGGGCFYQNRNDRDWHVEGMQAVKLDKAGKPQRVHVYYAQVGIFPKWLGDRVGWWCDEKEYGTYLKKGDYRMIGGNTPVIGLHTYGGDNELSARIWDLGFTIDPIPGAKISDSEAKDELREINNITGGHDPKAVKGHHPDSWKFGQKWIRRNERLGIRGHYPGPVLKDEIMITNPSHSKPRERVLYLPLFEQGWEVQKEQKRGLRDALAEVAIVREYDYMREYHRAGKSKMLSEIRNSITEFRPTIFLSQLHNSDQIGAQAINALQSHAGPGCRLVNWNGDYWPDQLLDQKGLNLAAAFHLMTTVNRDVQERHQAAGINTHYWQIGWEPDGRGHEPEIYHDVVFLASGYSRERQELGRFLHGLSYSVGIYGSGWPEGISKGQNLYNFVEACKIYRGAKLAIGDSQWPDSGFVSNRIFQILAAGNSALCHQWFRGIEELGLIDNVNCIIWQDRNDLNGKINYWLRSTNAAKLKEIAKAGEQLAINRHSFEARVTELWRMLGIDQPQITESWRW